jgi:hypothetical protein
MLCKMIYEGANVKEVMLMLLLDDARHRQDESK